LAGLRPEEKAHIVDLQSAKDVPPKRRKTGKLGQGFDHGGVAGSLCFPAGEHDHQAAVIDLPGDEPQQKEGWFIGPVNIVQH
jgi:hypothetical protein